MDAGCDELKMGYVSGKKSNKVEIDKEDLWPLLISTIRYSMGRMTYMVTYSQDMVEKYKQYLHDDCLKQIYDEVEKELTSYESCGRTMGMDFDHQSWKEFVRRGRNENKDA